MVEKIHDKKSTHKEKRKFNYYKLFTFILAAVIVIAILAASVVYSNNSSYESGVVFGQENAINVVLKEVSAKGFIEIGVGENKSVVLVSNNMVTQGQNKLVSDIYNVVSKEGFVELKIPGQEGSFVLVPHISGE